MTRCLVKTFVRKCKGFFLRKFNFPGEVSENVDFSIANF